MPLDRNPFSIVYDALWGLVSNHKPLAELVHIENRIRFDDKRDRSPLKDEISERDLPELRLISQGASLQLERTTNTTTLVQTYQFGVSTGEQRFDSLYDVNWELIRALSKWQTEIMELTWNSKPFILRLNPTDFATGVVDVDLNRGIKGWSSLWTVLVEMHFATIDLQGE